LCALVPVLLTQGLVSDLWIMLNLSSIAYMSIQAANTHFLVDPLTLGIKRRCPQRHLKVLYSKSDLTHWNQSF
jgi:hypothetical protein